MHQGNYDNQAYLIQAGSNLKPSDTIAVLAYKAASGIADLTYIKEPAGVALAYKLSKCDAFAS